jgi:preprotein translocase subunit SecG
MTSFTLAAVPFVMKIVMAIWVLAALILVFIVLIQKGKGGGLSAAFGGIGSSLLGTKTGDFLTWVTICIVAVWLLLSVVAVKWYKPLASEYLQGEQVPAVPASVPAPVPTAPAETANPFGQQPAENQAVTETQQSNTPTGVK